MIFTNDYFQDSNSEFKWSTKCPWCIIASMIGWEDELLTRIGTLYMHGIDCSKKAEDELAKFLVIERVSADLVSECAQICFDKGIRDEKYFFGILRNKVSQISKERKQKKPRLGRDD